MLVLLRDDFVTTVTIAGPIKKMVFNGNVLGNSTISAVGPNGNIGTLMIRGSMSGKITANRKIANATIVGSLSGLVTAPSIGTLKVGTINGGNLDIHL